MERLPIRRFDLRSLPLSIAFTVVCICGGLSVWSMAGAEWQFPCRDINNPLRYFPCWNQPPKPAPPPIVIPKEAPAPCPPPKMTPLSPHGPREF